MQHRFVYVGTDFQDLYGIDPATIATGGNDVERLFGNRDAQGSMAVLRGTSDGVLVWTKRSQTSSSSLGTRSISDFRAPPITDITLCPSALSGSWRIPHSASDSFVVANADYVSRMTGSTAAEVVLMRVLGDPSLVRDQAAQIVKSVPGAKVRDITEARKLIGSSLTAVDLKGLTRLELGYAVALSACGQVQFSR